MTVEEIRGDHENYDWNPVGLRVLAVDDDPICLKLLEAQLRKCQYNVTTSSQARIALNMLRENKGRFDLVISDVHMPDMDGFKLLELVGLEMDLPVIMLSANGDPKLVMKGVTHGACDYLVKPVRIEELRNIWQHVIRKKKSNPNRQNRSNEQGKSHQGNGDRDAQSAPLERNISDQSAKANRKRKEEEDDSDDDGNDSDDRDGQQKKPRVVWSIDLHRKFVGAVNQLGIDKAVPKRILDLMHVEGLTRENVASHLQKYRIYLKRINAANNQSVNMAAALGMKDAGFMRIGSLDGYNDFRSLTNPARLSHISLSSPYSSNNGMLGRLNSSSTNINLRNHSQSSLISPSQNLNINSLTGLGKVVPTLNQNPTLFQGIPTSMGIDQLQPNKSSPNFDDSRIFTAGGGNLFGNDPGAAAIGSSSNLLNGAHNNSVILNGNIVFGNQFSETFNSIQPIASDPFSAQLPMNSARENSSSNTHFLPNNSVELSSNNNMASANLDEQRWGENRQSFGHNSNGTFGSFTSNIPVNVLSPINRGDQNSGMFNNHKMQMGVSGRSAGGASLMQQQNSSDKMPTEPRARSNENFLLDQQDLHGGFAPQSFDSLDVFMNSIKREQDGNMSNCDFGFDEYSFGGV